MVTTIISDLGEVLLWARNETFYENFAKRSGLSPTEVKKRINTEYIEYAFNKGLISPQEFYRRLVETTGMQSDYETFKSDYLDVFSLNEKAFNAYKKLKGKYKLVLLSNINELHFEHIKQKFPEALLFDFYVLSYEIKSRKPELKIFQETLRICGSKPKECIYFDDKQKNVDVFRSLGVAGVAYTRDTNLEEVLRQNGVIV